MKKLIGLAATVCSFLILVCGLSGCGYTTRSMIQSKYKTIYIEPFLNRIDITRETDFQSKYKTYRPFLETDVTKVVNDKFLFDGNLKPIKGSAADLVLKGEVVDFSRDVLRYTDNDDAEEYRINVRVNISLWDTAQEKMLWEENNFTGIADYFTSFYPVASDRKDESVAVKDAIDDLARRIVERAVEEW